jgi:hypothetical protein
MSDVEYTRRLQRRIEEGLRELDTPRARYQAQLDRFWQNKLDEAAEHRKMMRELNPTGLKIW